jgi:hypothetical protein
MAEGFILSRNKEITQFSLLVALIRLFLFIFLCVDFAHGLVSKRRILVQSISILLELIILLGCYKYPIKLQKYHAALTILCFGGYLCDSLQDMADPTRQLNAFGGNILYIIFTALIISTNWILTSISAGAYVVGTCLYFINGLHHSTRLIITTMTTSWVLMCVGAYLCEKKFKREFLENK